MRKSALLTVVLAISLIVAGCGGGGGGGGGGGTGTGGGETSLTGVWIGNYSQVSSQASDTSAPKGPMCLELTQNGSDVGGKGWVSGYLWGDSLSGTVSGNTFSGTISGQDLGGSNISVSFSGTITSDQISGTVTVNNSATYNISLTKDTSKSNCGWASRELVLAFGEALGEAYGGGRNDLIDRLISLITDVPKVSVKIETPSGTNTYTDWWACIWEVRNNVIPSEMTLGAIINPDRLDPNGNMEFAAWMIDDDDIVPNIGLDNSLGSQPLLESFDAFFNKAVYVYRYDLGSSKYILLDGNADEYKNEGTQLSGDPFFVSGCMFGSQYKVWMTQIPFYIRFSGKYWDTGTQVGAGSFSSPPDAPASTVTIPALYIQIDPC